MFPIGIKYNIPNNTCLTTIKDLFPELRNSELTGPRRWSSVLSLPKVMKPKVGDLILWSDYFKFGFHARHIALIVNYDDNRIYHMGRDNDADEMTTKVTECSYCIQNAFEHIRFLRPNQAIV